MNSQTIGDYIIKRTIGRGTFSKVKLGVNKATNQKVAIKILEKSKILETDDLERIIREMVFIIEFDHPNVVKVHEIFETEENYLIIMDYCPGGELFNYIVQNRRLDDDEASFFYYQLINGIEYVHSKKIVHRDLKPENLLLDENGLLKIIDFGLSNYYEDEYLATPCGSPCYASPEMVGGNEYDGFGIDVWSTGIILFAMVCGYLPFEDSDNEILFKKILKCKLFFPNYVSLEVRDLLKKILVTDPEKRIKIKEIKEHKFYLKGKKEFEERFGVKHKQLEIDIDNNNNDKNVIIDDIEYKPQETNENNTSQNIEEHSRNLKTEGDIITQQIKDNDFLLDNNINTKKHRKNENQYKPTITEVEHSNHNTIKINDINNNNNKTSQNIEKHNTTHNNKNKLFFQINQNNNNIATKNNHVKSKTNSEHVTNKTTLTKNNKNVPKLNFIEMSNNSRPKHTVTLTTPNTIQYNKHNITNTIINNTSQNKTRKKTPNIKGPNTQLFINNNFPRTKRNLIFHPNKIVLHPRQHHPPQSTFNRKLIQFTIDSIEEKSRRNNHNVKVANTECYQQYNTMNNNIINNISNYNKGKLPSIKLTNNQRKQLLLFKPSLMKNNNLKMNKEMEGKFGTKKAKGLKIKDIVSLIKK